MDITLNWFHWARKGSEELLPYLQALYPELDLYKISCDWEKSPEYCAKAKGVDGDVIVTWEEPGE